MRLLILSNNPERASFRQRIGVHLDRLRESDIDCTVGRFPSGSFARRGLLKEAAHYDGVFLHKKTLNILDSVWLRRYARNIIYDFDDAVMYNGRNPERVSIRRRRCFKRTVKLADLIIAGNPYLAEQAKQYNRNVEVVPTGLDINAYMGEACRQNGGKIRLVWIGSKSTLRYLVSIRGELEGIGSRFHGVVLRIVSDEFFDLRNLEVEKCQWSLAREASDLLTSDVGLAPLPDNRFTRGKCGFKVLQYAAAGLPVVASPVGVNSAYIRDGITGFFARDSDEWTARITQLLENPQLRKEMGREARRGVSAFSVRVLEEHLINLIKRALSG